MNEKDYNDYNVGQRYGIGTLRDGRALWLFDNMEVYQLVKRSEGTMIV